MSNVQLLLGILGSRKALLVSKNCCGVYQNQHLHLSEVIYPGSIHGLSGCFLRWWENPPFQKKKLKRKPMGQLGKPTILGNGHLLCLSVYHDIFFVKESCSKRKMTTPPGPRINIPKRPFQPSSAWILLS